MTGVQKSLKLKLMDRYLQKTVLEDLKRKMVFISGPRQVGKTTLCLNLAPKNRRYMSWDILKDREDILREKFPRENFIIYDEIHKFKRWRNYIKGLYDRHRADKKILVTGSALLNYYRHSGDSLQGRYHHLRLHPLTVRELDLKSQGDITDLLSLGGFPEPFLSGSQKQARRWMREYKSRVINEDIPSLELSQNLSQMEQLLLKLPDRMGSPLSVNSLREDLGLAHKTVSKWLDIFERMCLIYRLPPYGSNRLRAVKKEQKHYHWNWAEAPEKGARFENLVAGHLLKQVHFQQDAEGRNTALCYFRDRDRREVDFVITENGKPLRAVECKWRQGDITSSLRYFKTKFPKTKCSQVFLEGGREYISKEGIENIKWNTFLRKFI